MSQVTLFTAANRISQLMEMSHTDLRRVIIMAAVSNPTLVAQLLTTPIIEPWQQLALNGAKIAAIRAYREAHDAALLDSKNAVDAWMYENIRKAV